MSCEERPFGKYTTHKISNIVKPTRVYGGAGRREGAGSVHFIEYLSSSVFTRTTFVCSVSRERFPFRLGVRCLSAPEDVSADATSRRGTLFFSVVFPSSRTPFVEFLVVRWLVLRAWCEEALGNVVFTALEMLCHQNGLLSHLQNIWKQMSRYFKYLWKSASYTHEICQRFTLIYNVTLRVNKHSPSPVFALPVVMRWRGRVT